MVVLRLLCTRFFLCIGGHACKSSGRKSYRTHAEEASPRRVFCHGSFFYMVVHALNLSFFQAALISRSKPETIRCSQRCLNASGCKVSAKQVKAGTRPAADCSAPETCSWTR